jgi:hypothetical protein
MVVVVAYLVSSKIMLILQHLKEISTLFFHLFLFHIFSSHHNISRKFSQNFHRFLTLIFCTFLPQNMPFYSHVAFKTSACHCSSPSGLPTNCGAPFSTLLESLTSFTVHLRAHSCSPACIPQPFFSLHTIQAPCFSKKIFESHFFLSFSP